MVSIFKRGNKLYLQFIVAGKKRQKSTGLEDTPANRRMVRTKIIPKLQAKIASGELEAEMAAKAMTKDFVHYAKSYLLTKENLKTYTELSNQVDKVVAAFKDRPIDKITRADVKEWVAIMLRTKTPKTVRKYINILGGIMVAAIDAGAIKDNPAKEIRLPTHYAREKKPFSADEVAHLLDIADGWFRNLLALLFYTGMRPGEALALYRGDVNLFAKTISVSKNMKRGIVTTPKTRYSIRVVPIFEALEPYIMDQMERSNGPLFPNQRGEHFWDAKKMHPFWHNLMKRSGLPYRDMYNTRHTFITAMLKSGYVSVLELAQIVGHKNSTEIMQNYARFIEGEHLKISKKLDPFACKSADSKAEKPTRWAKG